MVLLQIYNEDAISHLQDHTAQRPSDEKTNRRGSIEWF